MGHPLMTHVKKGETPDNIRELTAQAHEDALIALERIRKLIGQHLDEYFYEKLQAHLNGTNLNADLSVPESDKEMQLRRLLREHADTISNELVFAGNVTLRQRSLLSNDWYRQEKCNYDD